jgi:hypothetical protein
MKVFLAWWRREREGLPTASLARRPLHASLPGPFSGSLAIRGRSGKGFLEAGEQRSAAGEKLVTSASREGASVVRSTSGVWSSMPGACHQELPPSYKVPLANSHPLRPQQRTWKRRDAATSLATRNRALSATGADPAIRNSGYVQPTVQQTPSSGTGAAGQALPVSQQQNRRCWVRCPRVRVDHVPAQALLLRTQLGKA